MIDGTLGDAGKLKKQKGKTYTLSKGNQGFIVMMMTD